MSQQFANAEAPQLQKTTINPIQQTILGNNKPSTLTVQQNQLQTQRDGVESQKTDTEVKNQPSSTVTLKTEQIPTIPTQSTITSIVKNIQSLELCKIN